MVEELAFTSEVSKTAKQVVEMLRDNTFERDAVAFALALEPVRVMLMALFAFSKGGGTAMIQSIRSFQLPASAFSVRRSILHCMFCYSMGRV